jgi:hypothetical protein
MPTINEEDDKVNGLLKNHLLSLGLDIEEMVIAFTIALFSDNIENSDRVIMALTHNYLTLINLTNNSVISLIRYGQIEAISVQLKRAP